MISYLGWKNQEGLIEKEIIRAGIVKMEGTNDIFFH